MYIQLLKSGVTPSKELTSKILNSMSSDNPSRGFSTFFEAIRENGNIVVDADMINSAMAHSLELNKVDGVLQVPYFKKKSSINSMKNSVIFGVIFRVIFGG